MDMPMGFFIGKNEYLFGLNCFDHWYDSFLHVVCRKSASHLMFYCNWPAALQTTYGFLPGLIFNHFYKNATKQKSMPAKISELYY